MNSKNLELPPSIKRRLIRFNELIPCKTAFIDAKTPGSDKKENFCLIGGGVAENPDQVVHINIPHGFDIGGARQPKGCKNSHHSHNTEEVFFVHKGRWKFTWGEDGSDGEVTLQTGDTISIPTQVFRGFENIGPDDGFLYAVLGLNSDGTAGHVTWAPYVYKEAESHGLVLLKDGRLIDTSDGTAVPKNATLATHSSPDELNQFQRLSLTDMLECVAAAGAPLPCGGLSVDGTVKEFALIGSANPNENIAQGKIGWKHGFQVRRLTLQPGASISSHTRAEEEVLFVHAGSLTIKLPDAQFALNQGDLFTTPIDMPREYTNTGTEAVETIVVRRGNHPESAHKLEANP